MNILILGVGNAQLDAILYLKENGHKVFGLSYKHEGKGIEYIDEFEVINIIDREKVEEYVLKNNIELIYSVGSDIAMPTVGYVSRKVGLPFFVNEDIAELLQDKSLFRKFLLDHNLSPIPFISVSELKDIENWNNYPSIIKPVDGQGQRGIYELNSYEDLVKYFGKAKENSRSGKIIVEKYINGQEISVNCYVYEGEIIYNFISTRDTVKNYPGGIVSGHRIPVDVSKELKSNIEELVKNTIDKLGINNGPVYFQMKYHNTDVYIIEATARLDGCHIWRLIKEMYGVDLLSITFEHLIKGKAFEAPHLFESKKLELRFFLNKPGNIFKTHDYEISQNALFKEFYYSENEVIRPINGHMDKVGYQIIEKK